MLRSPCGARNPLEGICTTKIDRFATLGLWANRSFFLPEFYGGTFSVFNPWRGRWVAPEDAAGFILPQPKPLGQKPGESKGVLPLVPEVKTSSKSRTRRFLAYLSQHLCCYFPLREKVGRGMGRSAHKWGCGDTQSPLEERPRGPAEKFKTNPARPDTGCRFVRYSSFCPPDCPPAAGRTSLRWPLHPRGRP